MAQSAFFTELPVTGRHRTSSSGSTMVYCTAKSQRQLSRKPTLLPYAASHAIGQDLPITQHLGAGGFMRTRDIPRLCLGGVRLRITRVASNGRRQHQAAILIIDTNDLSFAIADVYGQARNASDQPDRDHD